MVGVVKVVRVATHVTGDAAARIRFKEPRADIDRNLVIGHPDLRLVSGWLAGLRLLLQEVPERGHVSVQALVKSAVDGQGFVEPHGADGGSPHLISRDDGRGSWGG